MKVKFTYTDIWKAIPPDEEWEVGSDMELEFAVQEFKGKHESYGSVQVFGSGNDGIDWKIIDNKPGDDRYQCKECKQYLCERLLMRFDDEVVCLVCWKGVEWKKN